MKLIDEKIKRRILELLYESAKGFTFLELFKTLVSDGLIEDSKKSWRGLKLTLMKLEDEGLIEERHFEDGRVNKRDD